VAGSVGALFGPPLVAAAIFTGAGWRAVFAALALLTLTLALAAARIPSPARERRPALGRALRDAWRSVRSWAVLRWLALLEASDLLLDVFIGFVALYLVAEGLSEGGAALAVGIWVAAGLVGSLAVLRWLRRASGARYLRASAIAAAALLAGFLVVPGLAAKLSVLAALGMVTAGWYPLLKARLYEELPGRSGTAMSLSASMDPVGALPPLAIGLAAEAFGLGTALWLLLVGPAALLALVPRPRLGVRPRDLAGVEGANRYAESDVRDPHADHDHAQPRAAAGRRVARGVAPRRRPPNRHCEAGGALPCPRR
jgi:fucose permease